MDYITPIKKQLDKKMHEVCNIFMLIGTPRETPRYYNLAFKTFKLERKNNDFIYIGSTQNSNLFFKIKVKENYFENLRLETNEFWQQFKDYRTKFLLKNYPTINAY